MSEKIETPLIKWMTEHRQATRIIMIVVCFIILPLGGYLMIRDLTHAIVTHNKAGLLKFLFLFVAVTFGAIRSRPRYAKIIAERDR